MHDYEVRILVNGRSFTVTISANSTTQARHIAEAQFSEAKQINVLRQIR